MIRKREPERQNEWYFAGTFQWFNCNNFNNEFDQKLIERAIKDQTKRYVSETFLQYISTIDKVSFYNRDVIKPNIKFFDDFKQFDEHMLYLYGPDEAKKFNNWVSNYDKLDIFICAHKSFDIYPKNPVYKVIYGENNSVKTNLKHYVEKNDKDSLYKINFAYAEGSRIYWIWKHVPLKEYIGINHYRTYFEFFDKVPNISEIFRTHDVVLTKPENFSLSTMEQYKMCHNVKDLMTVQKIIEDYYPDYINDINETMSRQWMYPRNMFIMRKADFLKYCEFVFGVMKKFDEIMNFHTDEDVHNYVNAHASEYSNVTLNYQSRIEGFLIERLTNVFIHHQFKNPMIYNQKVTEETKW